jgi:sigma-54 dependent transcriptional regulator, acetoin dehydrogenase operon transcriptional activator AcoR
MQSWPGNFMQLDKAIRHAVSQSKGDVIREEIKEYLKGPLDEGLTPCSKCLGSPIKEKTCITIRRSWKETGGKVSLVARRLGISRNTVYKHIMTR